MDEKTDALISGEQPRCPECGVLMRGNPAGYACPACGHHDVITDVENPGEGSGLLDFRRRR
ncbi:hypothetical protein Q9S36_14855 [Microbacterium sp. ARD31]|uniref:hypothetical protein n=1 Tax=Microbacterium sp. ARD31 TaxID=2962576 RepID=UPI0028828C42|nr:hypothetical protein [Microbacterium sp. ARD31]MDT0181460.1 hypothetical protein [Microbacterium sp. ARD31]